MMSIVGTSKQILGVILAIGLGGVAVLLRAQSAPASQPAQTPGSQPGQSDNPFPGNAPKKPDAAQTKPDGTKAKPSGSDNPFPGEDTSAPIIPVEDGVSTGAGNNGRAADPHAAEGTATRGASANGDPVRSPDGDGNVIPDDGFSSSRNGVGSAPDDNETDARPGKSARVKTRSQLMKEDLDVGGFYLEKKDWKGAEGRFEAAFALDKENESAVWGLAESERHLNLLAKAREHYELFLSYDPDGPHSKAAKKALEQVEAAESRGVGNAPNPGADFRPNLGTGDLQPK